ncbi:hypothetical protein EC968_002332 [Mortierella alpina]|nr:hypothetical protein EC968_002332 [Mortierella alpina]
MSNPGTGGSNPNVYPQPIGTLSGSTAAVGGVPLTFAGAAGGMPIAPRTDVTGGNNAPTFATSSQSVAPPPITSPPVGTAPRKQLAAAAAAGAAAGVASLGKSGRQKGSSKKSGAGAGAGRRGGRGGGRGGRAGGASGSGAGGGSAGDDDDGAGGGGKDSDDDNEDEPEVSIEEQFILRLPPGEMCDRFREKVIAREVDESVKLRFSDARRGTFTFEGLDFPTKLVDLPTIIEAQKTLNGKQMYKIADISQLLLVDPVPVESIANVKSEPATNGDSRNSMPAPTLPPLKPSEYIWPDGLTNPLKNAVEGVENEIERLLQEDAQAEEVVYEIREQIDGMDRFDSDDGATPAPEGAHSDMDMEMEGEGDEEEEEEEDEQYDEDLFAEIEREIGIEGGENATDEEGDDSGTPQRQDNNSATAEQPTKTGTSSTEVRTAGMATSGLNMVTDTKAAAGAAIPSSATSVDRGGSGNGKQGADDDEEEDDEEEDEEDDDDDDDSGSEDEDEEEEEEDKERAQLEKLLKDEIKELNGKVRDNEEKVQSAPNDILKRRFGSILENLRRELKLKTDQLDEVKDRGKSKGK